MSPVRKPARPHAFLSLAACSLVGLAVGLGGFLFVYADVPAYLADESSACANCHVMQGHFDAWSRSSHRENATCNDCHTSHESTIAKYGSKAVNGFNHALAFTTGRYPETLRLSPFNRRITESACRHCHGERVHGIGRGGGRAADGAALACTTCHASVGHDR